MADSPITSPDHSAEVKALLNDVTAETDGGRFVMAHVRDDPANNTRIKEFKASVQDIPHPDGRCGRPKSRNREGVL